MAAAKLYNLARMTVSGTPGTGAITLDVAASNGITFNDAGVQDGELLTIGIEDGSASAVCRATYTASGTSLTIVDTINSTNSNAQLSLTSAAEVFITAAARDIQKFSAAASLPSNAEENDVWLDLRNWEYYTYIPDDNGDLRWVSQAAVSKMQNRLRLAISKGLWTGGSWDTSVDGGTFTGDLFVAFAFRDGSTTAPTLATGFTDINSGGANSCSYRTAYRIATADNETIPTFTNATSIQILVFRNFDTGAPIGADASSNGSSTTVTVPTLTKTKPDNRSFMVFAFGHRSTDIDAFSGEFSEFARVGFTDDGTTDTTNIYWTPRPYAGNFGGDSIGVNGTASGWISSLVEIQGAAYTDWSLPPANPTQNDGWGGCTWDGEKWTTVKHTTLKAYWLGGYDSGGGSFTAQNWSGLVGMAHMGNSVVLYPEAKPIDPDGAACVTCAESNGQFLGPVYVTQREIWLGSEAAATPSDADYMMAMVCWDDNTNDGHNNWYAPG